MRRYFLFILIIVLFFLSGLKNSYAGQLAPIYDLGENYTLHLGHTTVGSYHNVIGLEKGNVATEGDALLFALTPHDNRFGDNKRSVGFIYAVPLQQKVVSTLSLTDDSADAKNVVIGFQVHIKLE